MSLDELEKTCVWDDASWRCRQDLRDEHVLVFRDTLEALGSTSFNYLFISHRATPALDPRAVG